MLLEKLNCIATKGLDAGGWHLRRSIAYETVQVFRRWEKERRVLRTGKAGSAVSGDSLRLPHDLRGLFYLDEAWYH